MPMVIVYLGDRVAKWITASVPMCTVADSKPDHGQHLSLGRQLIKEKGCHPPKYRAW